jgi:hypothetical protein
MPTVVKSPTVLLPSVGMSQSGLMVAALIGGFVVFIAMQGKLASYWSILLGGSSSPTSPATTVAPAPSSSTTIPGAGSTAPATTPTPSNSSLGLPSSLGSFFGGLGGTTATLPATGTQGGTVGFNALSLNAASGLTPGSSFLFPGSG